MSAWLAARAILAIRLDNTGDVIMLGPALRAVKETSPAATITLLASPAGSTAAPLLPWIDDVIVWRAAWQDLGQLPFDPARERVLIDTLAARAFEAALVFTSFSQTPHAPGYLCYLAGIPLRAGESKEFGGATLSTELRGAADDLHQVERNLRLVEHLGFRARDRRLRIEIPLAAQHAVPGLLRRAGLAGDVAFVVFHPGASARARRYPAERAGRVIELLRADGWPVLLTGAEREADLIAEILRVSPGTAALVGGTSLPELAALIDRAALVISGNTLPMHLADAVGTPALTLFSGTDLEAQWGPRSTASRLLRRPTSCHPCYRFDCPIGLPCLDIPPEEVVAEAEAMLHAAGYDRVTREAAVELGR